ncbi:hypothetical protein [Zooshikella sp. RANM57]|uniref:hypothetical protein n=1 Tax=Zooshikella sp. RANM57 TaxID=3425863 RepID=UPI003D6E49E3
MKSARFNWEIGHSYNACLEVLNNISIISPIMQLSSSSGRMYWLSTISNSMCILSGGFNLLKGLFLDSESSQKERKLSVNSSFIGNICGLVTSEPKYTGFTAYEGNSMLIEPYSTKTHNIYQINKSLYDLEQLGSLDYFDLNISWSDLDDNDNVTRVLVRLIPTKVLNSTVVPTKCFGISYLFVYEPNQDEPVTVPKPYFPELNNLVNAGPITNIISWRSLKDNRKNTIILSLPSLLCGEIQLLVLVTP